MDLAQRPNRIMEFVPSLLSRTFGAHDTDKTGVGGVHFVPLLGGSIETIMWRSIFT
jgi:hypothetical protein